MRQMKKVRREAVSAERAGSPAKARKPRFKRETPEKRRSDLIDAAIRCLAEGGMAAFKMERVAAEADVSLGLVSHYFTSKDELLTEMYRRALYDDVNRMVADGKALDAGPPARRLCQMIDSIIDPKYLKSANLTIWLTLWGEIIINPVLRRTHRTLYRSYMDTLSRLIAAVAAERQRPIDAAEMARNFQALIDGLYLERALDSRALAHTDLRRAAYQYLELQLGPLDQKN
jgi:TetR/AcrR family transcriptional regulator, transcriptional repressor of bet genes